MRDEIVCWMIEKKIMNEFSHYYPINFAFDEHKSVQCKGKMGIRENSLFELPHRIINLVKILIFFTFNYFFSADE
jgi:hypothetical protein